MMSYYVLTPPGSSNPEKDTLFIRDGFSWMAFLFPLPWLLVRKLWMIAGVSVIFYLLSVLAAEYWGLDALPLAFSFILSLWTGLEGGHVRAHWLVRKGWDLKATVAAEDVDEAEALYFAGDAAEVAYATPVYKGTAASSSRPNNSVALGLIGPFGSR